METIVIEWEKGKKWYIKREHIAVLKQNGKMYIFSYGLQMSL